MSKYNIHNSEYSNELKGFGYEFDVTDNKCKYLGKGSYGIVGSYINNNLKKTRSNSKRYVAIKTIDISNIVKDGSSIGKDVDREIIISTIIKKQANKKCKSYKRFLLNYNYIEGKKKLNVGKYNGPKYLYMISEVFDSDLMQFLKDMRNDGKLNLSVMQSLMFQIVKGLSCLEKLGIIHYDLKPENILINNDGVLKIMDFGGSGYNCGGEIKSSCERNKCTFKDKKSSKRDCEESDKEPFIYTSYYIAPENVTEEYPLTTKNDIWASGIILLEMIRLASNTEDRLYDFFHKDELAYYEQEDIDYFIKRSLNRLENIECKKGKKDLGKECFNELRNLLENMLEINENKRFTAEKTLEHNFFKYIYQ